MKYPNVICRAILTVLIIVQLLANHVAAEELDQAATNTALENYEKWKTKVGTRTAVVAGGAIVTLAWSELSPEQWKAMCPDGTDLITK